MQEKRRRMKNARQGATNREGQFITRSASTGVRSIALKKGQQKRRKCEKKPPRSGPGVRYPTAASKG